MNKEKTELKAMNINELANKVEEYRAELFSMRLNATTEPVKNYSKFKQLRKNIARALSYLNQKKNEQ